MLYIYFGQNVCFQTASTACDARKNLDLLEHVSHHFLFNSSNCNICFSFSSSLSLRLLSVINRHFKSTFYFVKKYHDCRAFRFVFFLLFLYISIFDFVRNRLFAQSVSFFRIGSHMFSNCSPPDTPLSPEHDTEFRDQDYPSFQDEASFEEQPPAELFGLEFDNNVNCLDQDQSDACSVQSPDEHVVGQNRLSDDDEDRSRSTEQLAEDYEQEQEPAANEKTDSNDSIEEGEASDSDDPLMNDEQKKVETCRRPTDEELEDGEVIDDDEGEADNDALNKGGKISTATAAHKRDIEMRNNYGRNYYPQSNGSGL